MTFTDSSTGTITNRFWSFGDGATTNTTSTNLIHTYANPGSYDVSLIVFGFPAGIDTLTQIDCITATNFDYPPVASFYRQSNQRRSFLGGDIH